MEREARRPAWGLIAVFYGVCMAWVSLITAGIYLAGGRMDVANAQLVFQLTVAFLYMPAPLVAALIAERVGRRRPLIRTTFEGFMRKLPRLLGAFVVVVTLVYVADMGLMYLLGNVLHLPNVGVLVTNQAELTGRLASLAGEMGVPVPATTEMPPVGALYVAALVGAFTAGLTINGLFAFGEEYGWRGFLMDELRPLGPVAANLLTGVLWGLFHAPLILLGFNYAPYNLAGVGMMIVFVTPFSFLLWRAREHTGSLFAAAIIHGGFNAFAGFFLLLVLGRHPLVSAPVGLIGALGLALVAAAYWAATAGRTWENENGRRRSRSAAR